MENETPDGPMHTFEEIRQNMGVLSVGRFDEKCPHCEKKLDVHHEFQRRDYAAAFIFNCPFCEKPISCDVHSIPEFELEKYKGQPERW